MANYIDREIAIKEMLSRFWDGKETLREIMMSVPAADVAPVRCGKWVHTKCDKAHCSECGYTTDDNLISLYCPSCGAEMDQD